MLGAAPTIRIAPILAAFSFLCSVRPAFAVDPFSVWSRDLRVAIEKLEAGETKSATRKLDALLKDYANLAGPGETNERNLGTILLYRAIAMQQAGRADDARWDMDLAAIFFPSVNDIDLERFGDAGRVLSAYAELAERERAALAASESELPEEAVVDDDQISPPKLVRKVKPRYPTGARQFRARGTLVVEVRVDEAGRVAHPRVLVRNPHPGLTYSTLQAIRKWRFEPATLKGRPVKVRYDVTVHFAMR